MIEPARSPSRVATGLAAGIVLIGALHFAVGDLTWWGECITVWPTVGWLMLLAPRLAIWARRKQWNDVRLVGASAIVLVASIRLISGRFLKVGFGRGWSGAGRWCGSHASGF